MLKYIPPENIKIAKEIKDLIDNMTENDFQPNTLFPLFSLMRLPDTTSEIKIKDIARLPYKTLCNIKEHLLTILNYKTTYNQVFMG